MTKEMPQAIIEIKHDMNKNVRVKKVSEAKPQGDTWHIQRMQM